MPESNRLLVRTAGAGPLARPEMRSWIELALLVFSEVGNRSPYIPVMSQSLTGAGSRSRTWQSLVCTLGAGSREGPEVACRFLQFRGREPGPTPQTGVTCQRIVIKVKMEAGVGVEPTRLVCTLGAGSRERPEVACREVSLMQRKWGPRPYPPKCLETPEMRSRVLWQRGLIPARPDPDAGGLLGRCLYGPRGRGVSSADPRSRTW